RHQPEQLGGGEADVQGAGLAAGRSRVAQRALEERAEHEADADTGRADADRRDTGTDYLSRSEIHFTNSVEYGVETLVKVDRIVDVQRGQKGEHERLDGADQQLQRVDEDDEQER